MRRSEQEVRTRLTNLNEDWAGQRAAEEYARKFSTDERQKLAKQGKAKPDGSFPVESEEDLKNAIGLARSPADRAHVKKQAARLGKSGLIPDTWAATDDHDSEMMKAIAAAVQMQEEAPDLKTDAADSQVLSHLHAARAAQQRDMDGHAASAGY